MKLVLVSGMSGAGKSVALKSLEDLGFYSVDNLPLELLKPLIAWHRGHNAEEKLAISIDSRSNTKFNHIRPVLEELNKTEDEVKLLFFDAREDVIMRRYSETRRHHPLQNNRASLPEAIKEERILLGPVREEAVVLDTSYMSVPKLRRWIQDLVGIEGKRLQLIFESFGFKFGIPIDANFVFDIRCLPNPYYAVNLRDLRGYDSGIIDFFEQFSEVGAMADDIEKFLKNWLETFVKTTGNTLTIAIGCTGGVHRSVYMVEKLASRFRSDYTLLVRHRQLADTL